MQASNAKRDDTMTGSITAKPGTPEYQRQFEKQALGAADSILRLWFVRVVCGAYAALFLLQPIQTFDLNVSWADWAQWFFYSIGVILIGIECGSVALFAKSFLLRYGLSGAKRKS